MTLLRLALASLLFCLAALPAMAADTLHYDVSFTGVGGEIGTAIHDNSLLVTLKDAGAVAPFALVERARRDGDVVKAVLESFGFYAATVRITIAEKDLADPALFALLDAAPNDQTIKVVVAVTRGPQYLLDNVSVTGTLPKDALDALGIRHGDPAVAANVLAGQAHLLSALQEDGYAFARVDAPAALADDAAHTIDVTYNTDLGPKVTLGSFAFKGLKDVNEDFVRATLTLKSGEVYKPSRIAEARQDLAALGVFSGVSVRAADHPNPDDSVDLTFDLQERAMHTVAFSAAYSTDLGASGSASWTHHSLFGNAEELKLSAAITGAGGSASSGIGYNVSAHFVKPLFLERGQALEADLVALKQDLDAYSQTAQSVAGYVRRKFSPLWSGSAGLSFAHDEVTQQNTTRLYQLIATPVTASYESVEQANPLTDPTGGFRAAASVTPTLSFGASNRLFVILKLSGSGYFDFGSNGASVLALRATVASIEGATNLDVPPDQRLYAGGGATVRGFRYQSIGPRFANGDPIGATSMDAGTVEFRQRVLDDWGIAAFVDAGQASTASLPFAGALNIGAGLGVRYYTPIGAIRASVAVPLTAFDNRDSFEVYIGLGQAF
ncbi:MAG: outer membrane protein assembly factor [Proteobacteria bacterium]|nr:outer membrane protein assembly factor [Pseudomonadota bacterium]